MSLSLEDVSIAVGGHALLRGVGRRLEPGEIVGLLGRNGVGKTSLLRVAAGTLPAAAGRVALEGRPLAAWSRREIARRVAVVPQDSELPFAFSVEEVALMGRAPHQGLLGLDGAPDRERARAALARVGIAGLAERSVLALSGGERQLAAFARALVQAPRFLLLDEPTAFLDLRHRLRVMEVVAELVREGAGALVVSHDLTLAARGCHRLVLLGEGGIVAEGPPAEVVRPDTLARAFGIRADVHTGADGAPVVVPLAAADEGLLPWPPADPPRTSSTS